MQRWAMESSDCGKGPAGELRGRVTSRSVDDEAEGSWFCGKISLVSTWEEKPQWDWAFILTFI